MLKHTAFILVLGTVILSGCGAGQTSELTGSKATSAAFKPKLDVKVETAGKNATVYITTDVKISKEHFGYESVKGEGHSHIYLDNGEKVQVVENKYEFRDLAPGKHTVKVSLHNNDHTPYDVTKELDFEIK